MRRRASRVRRLPRSLSQALIPIIWLAAFVSGAAHGADSAPVDPLGAWRSGAAIRDVSPTADRHTIHSYFNTSPESPDGRWVLFYSSATAVGQEGDLRVVERATGQERLLARGLNVEDAHRAACQQWVLHGRAVAFHDVQEGRWSVNIVDLDSGRPQVLARDRQLAFAAPGGALLPVYGCHWNPGEHRDLELIDAASGTIRVAVTAAAVRETYPDWVSEHFGQRPISIFFPVLSPDGHRVFFKIATPGGGDFRSSKASTRLGLVCFDLEHEKFLFLRSQWGHPAWHPDGRTILEVGHLLIDSDNQGATRRIAGLPEFSGSHPSVSPDGRLFVTDTQLDKFGGTKGQWGIVVGSLEGGASVIIDRFDNAHGARSWRRSHPHPVFSPDGKRIYYNVSSTAWTRLRVAEAGAP